MCVVKISDKVMDRVGLHSDEEATIEFACRLFDANKLGFGEGAEMAGVSDERFAEELRKRNIRFVEYTLEMLQEDIKSVREMRS